MENSLKPVGVLIPAHNEELVIGRCLDALLADAKTDEFLVVVAANGCTDKTAEVASRFPVKVIELSEGCKTTALNCAESLLPEDCFPRIYLDADLVLTTESARIVTRAVHQIEGVLAAAPKFTFDLTEASLSVRQYYKAWDSLPYSDSGRIAGAFALSAAGRSRFDQFPKLVSDDGYVRLQFQEGERVTVDTAEVIVTTPRSLGDLVKVKTRSRLGTVELRKRFPELRNNDNTGSVKTLVRMLTTPRQWMNYPTYVLINVISRIRALRQFKAGQLGVWERDNSSRQLR